MASSSQTQQPDPDSNNTNKNTSGSGGDGGDQSLLTRQLLARAHSPDSAARIFAEKIQHRPLLLKPSAAASSDARSARRAAREAKARARAGAPKPKPLSARQRRALGLRDAGRRRAYATYEPLHRLWLGYVREVLGGDLYGRGTAAAAAAKLAAADYHGAEAEVARSRCPSRVGIRGIVVRDARSVFEIVTRDGRVKTVPKEGTVFRIRVPAEGDGGEKVAAAAGKGEGEGVAESSRPFTFEIHGDQFRYRAADRANRKFRQHFLKNL
ncbi:ribonuclease P protein subunit p29 [Durotheca rogersii]|uniref:ribonuclease P protein subunit p29 n=1 Tax=Durotheca rogersii TaxID=419775 RepID=UPI00221EDDA8|nr:ribonuclease P protein subunit p29 [Durotheca rogersii]KAI5861570.1 ribonuclease P protein subunit p29 [Durotheca rogersii]